MGAYMLSDWNGLVDQINFLGQKPPPGCTAAPKVENVSAPHVWSWTNDVLKAQQALLHICSGNTFTSHTLWQQSIVDEINAAIRLGWCDCSSVIFSNVKLGTYPPTVYSYTSVGGSLTPCPGTAQPINLDALVNGVSPPLEDGYFYLAVNCEARWLFQNGGLQGIATYPIVTTGSTPDNGPNQFRQYVTVPPTSVVGDHFGMHVDTTALGQPNGTAIVCSTACSDPGCQAAINNATAQLNPSDTVDLLLYFEYKQWNQI